MAAGVLDSRFPSTGVRHCLEPLHVITARQLAQDAEELSQLTWKLDAEKPAAFKFNEGFWIVRPDPLDAACSIVYYSIAVELKGWVPPFVNSYVAKTGLPRAVAWVQKEAEARAAAATPPTTQLSPPSKTKIVRDACWAKLAAECQCRDEIPRGPFACLLGPLAACLPPPPRA